MCALSVARLGWTRSCSTACSPLRGRPMQIFYNDVYEAPLPSEHRFPMEKYRLVREHVQRSLCPNLAQFHLSPFATKEELQVVHCPSYIDRYIDGNLTDREVRRVGFPWSRGFVAKTLTSTGGTIAAMRAVAENGGMAAQIAGGTHHAFYDRGEGFCVFNDLAVAAALARREYPSTIGRRVVIVDLDVHQGNGTAVLFAQEPDVFTFSMHCRGNYFSAVQKSDLDVEVPVGAGDEDYLPMLEDHLRRVFDSFSPTFCLYQAGVDPLRNDRLGRLKMTREGLRRRNKIVYDLCVDGDIPVVVTLGGGYPRNLDPASVAYQDVVDAHGDAYIQAAEMHAQRNENLRVENRSKRSSAISVLHQETMVESGALRMENALSAQCNYEPTLWQLVAQKCTKKTFFLQISQKSFFANTQMILGSFWMSLKKKATCKSVQCSRNNKKRRALKLIFLVNKNRD